MQDAEETDALRRSGPVPLFQISVDDPQKVGDPIRPYILYTVHTKASVRPLSVSIRSHWIYLDNISLVQQTHLLSSQTLLRLPLAVRDSIIQ